MKKFWYGLVLLNAIFLLGYGAYNAYAGMMTVPYDYGRISFGMIQLGLGAFTGVIGYLGLKEEW